MKKSTLIKSYCIDTNKSGPHVLVTAGVHGDEYEPILAAMELINHLSDVLESGRVTVVPVTNETAYFNQSRYGEDGLDLARVCPGNPEGTVTERVADQISALIGQADYFVDMHTGGLAYDIYPLAGYMLHHSPTVLEMQREMALNFNLPLVWGTDPRPNGRTLSVARDANIPAIYLEYGGGTGVRTHVVAAYRNGFVNLLKSLGMAKPSVQEMAVKDKYWIEDHRPDSGHLQAKMPSPSEGIFIAEVEIGDQLVQGQVFGKVVEPFSGETVPVYAGIGGLVFLLRKMVKVKAGDALGGIMPIQELNKRVTYEE